MAAKATKKAKKPVKKVAAKKVAAKKPVKKAAKPAPKAASKAAQKAPKAAAPAGEKQAKTRTAVKPKNSSGSYTQSEFLENLRAFCGLSKRTEARELVEDISALVKETLKKGYKIPLFGLGKMYVRHTKARIGRNPQTGEQMQVPARKRVRFAPAKALKEAVL